MSNTVNVYGKNAIRELLKGKRKVYSIYTYQNIDEELLNLINKKNIKIWKMEKNEFFNKFKDTNSGIVAVSDEYQYADFDKLLDSIDKKEEAILLILVGLEDPHNLGAIIRSAEATAIDGIIIPKNRSVGLNETVIKVSTGAIENVNVSQVINITQMIEKLKNHGFWIIGLELCGTMNYQDAPYDGKVALVVGSEGKGIPKMVIEHCDLVVKIPMYGKINSLNASVSAGLILYEAKRCREK